MKSKIKQAITETIKETQLSRDSVDELLIAVDTNSLLGFGTDESVNFLLEYVYSEEQDEILDFITLLELNLRMAGVTKEYMSALLTGKNKIFSGDTANNPVSDKLILQYELNYGEPVLLITLLFMLKLNIKMCIIENSRAKRTGENYED